MSQTKTLICLVKICQSRRSQRPNNLLLVLRSWKVPQPAKMFNNFISGLREPLLEGDSRNTFRLSLLPVKRSLSIKMESLSTPKKFL